MSGTQTYTVSQSDLARYTNQTIVITGGASGIGLATALLLHSLGNNIVILDRSAPVASPQTDALTSSPRYLLCQGDICHWNSQRAGFQSAIAKFSHIDAVYVNAGIAEHGDQFFTDTLDSAGELAEPDRRCVDIDLHAADDTVKLAIYWMRKDAKHGKGRGGSIVMTASIAGYLASAGAPLYSAAKHGEFLRVFWRMPDAASGGDGECEDGENHDQVRLTPPPTGIVGLMRALKHDVATLSIAISVVAPGITVTPILGQERKDLTQSRNIEEWAAKMQKAGVPINRPEAIALAVAGLMAGGMKSNGSGVMVQADKMANIEAGIARSREMWMGEEMLRLFRGGRNAPLFPNKL